MFVLLADVLIATEYELIRLELRSSSYRSHE